MPESAKHSLSSVLPVLKPKIRRRFLRKYSWLPDVLRLKGSIVGTIFGPVLTVTIFAAIVSYAWSIGKHVTMTNSVVPLLSVVVGLILVFRNGTSYDRYWEGRKSFAAITSNIRNLARLLWINVALPPTDEQPTYARGKTPIANISEAHLRHKKIDTVKLCLSFAFAVKHYLREEDGTQWDDYTDILPVSFRHFREGGYKTPTVEPHAATRNSSKADSHDDSGCSSPDATKRVRVKRSKTNLTSQHTPLLSGSYRSVEVHDASESIPLPLVIAHEITRNIFHFRREGLLETVGPAGTNAMSQLVQSMVDQMTAMERIANTPIPISYGIHLKQCVTLYLFTLPFTLVHDLAWYTIPVVTVVAFTFMGIEGIADNIEMPFGKNPSDLPLDRYCSDLKEEIEYLIRRLPEGGQGGHGYDDGEGDD